MPLSDRPDFRAWLDRRNSGLVGRPHGDPDVCTGCANRLDHRLGGDECLVCLAEQYGIETVEAWIADVIAGFVRAAADPATLAGLVAESIALVREIVEIHAPRSAA